MRRVLITGASGFIGRHVALQCIEKKFEVHGVCLRGEGIPLPGITWHRADLLDPQARLKLLKTLRAKDLIHLAWYTEPGLYQEAQENRLWLEASQDLLGCFKEEGGERAVFAGSCAEDLQQTPFRSPYGESKARLRQWVESFRRSSGLKVAWAKIFFPYGPFEKSARLIPSLIRALVQGESFGLNQGGRICDLIHVEDVAQALSELLEKGGSGDFELGSGQGISLLELAQRLEKIAQTQGKFLAASSPMDFPAAQMAKVDALKKLSIHPRWNLDEGLAQTFHWWQDRRPWDRK